MLPGARVVGGNFSPGLRYGNGAVPQPGTILGNQVRAMFVQALLVGGFPDCRLLWLPANTDTTTSATQDRNARTLTYDASIATRLSALGSGEQVSFDGAANYGSVPDAANLSFGDSVVDAPMSIAAWINFTNSAAIKTILSKYDITTGATQKEWWFYIDAANKLRFEAYDDSVPANIGRLFNTALTQSVWQMVVATYDGSGVNGGVRLYRNGLQIDDTASSAGVYVAMEDKTSLGYLGAHKGAAAVTEFFNGAMACAALFSGKLTVDQIWELKTLGNSFFGLTL